MHPIFLVSLSHECRFGLDRPDGLVSLSVCITFSIMAITAWNGVAWAKRGVFWLGTIPLDQSSGEDEKEQ